MLEFELHDVITAVVENRNYFRCLVRVRNETIKFNTFDDLLLRYYIIIIIIISCNVDCN